MKSTTKPIANNSRYCQNTSCPHASHCPNGKQLPLTQKTNLYQKTLPLLLTATLTPTLPAQLDLNGDGMSDVWAAVYNAQNLLPNVDTDRDGCTNLEESIAGTNPFSAASKIDLILPQQFTNPLTLSFPSIAGKSYQLSSSPDLNSWTDSGSPMTGTGSMLNCTVTPSATKQFWRLNVSDLDADLDGLTAYEETLLNYSDNDSYSSNIMTGTDFTAALTNFGSPGSFVFQGQSMPGTPPSLTESSRFLQQATMGSTYPTIQGVSATGIPAWLENQFAIPATSHVVRNNALTISEQDETGESFPESPYIWTWWNTALYGTDALRQRVAFALSEIFVIGQTTDVLEDRYYGIATYYDVLVNNAFGNYRDLLYEVATNPAMGHYLSHVKNRPTDLANNIFPDENFAREIMQLFSIGLFELNQDGSRMKDAQGNDIPTYDNTDITNFAKVFTGLTYNPINPNNGTPWENEDPGPVTGIEDYLGAADLWMGIEMAQYDPMHEPGIKFLLNGASTNGNTQQDLDAAIDNLFNHPNTGPFIGRLLIQRLVTSNPSPDYIYRVAAAFNDNGFGVRGDMKSLLRAILLDPEARNRSSINNPQFGKLREPVLRHTHIARAFQYQPSSGALRMDGFDARVAYAQQPMLSPSVFNFYLPDHQPLGPIKDAGLVAPEFQITTATTTIKNLNFYSHGIPFDFLVLNTDENTEVLNDYSAEEQLLEDDNIPGFLDRLDILLTRGQMTPTTRSALQLALEGALASNAGPGEIARFMVSLIASSPDFAILK
ncbi:MAG: DUF1800 family protein [Verrucomicrobiota bacterium]